MRLSDNSNWMITVNQEIANAAANAKGELVLLITGIKVQLYSFFLKAIMD